MYRKRIGVAAGRKEVRRECVWCAWEREAGDGVREGGREGDVRDIEGGMMCRGEDRCWGGVRKGGGRGPAVTPLAAPAQ